MQNLPIGVFDSGVGGLTVLKQCQALLPNETFIYLGDTARLPYGTKSPETVTQYAKQMTHLLIAHGIKALVIACNTASALAFSALQQTFVDLPILGVLIPGAKAAVAASRNQTIAVIATEATIAAEGYHKAIKHVAPNAHVVAKACGLFVALAEEGWGEHPVARQIAHEYLDDMFTSATIMPDTLVLGCTHFPLLKSAIDSVVGPQVTIIDSAHASALALAELLQQHDLVATGPHNGFRKHFLVTDSPRRFQRIAHYFLGEDIAISDVQLVDAMQLKQ